jgi:hypothetical protein
MTARIATCRDLTKNRADLKRLQELFVALQTTSTPASLLLPWLPSSTKKANKEATTDLFTMLYRYIEVRRRAEPTDDAIDILIANGETNQRISEVNFALNSCGVGLNSAISVYCGCPFRGHP